MASAGKQPFKQPLFDERIYSLYYPLGSAYGQLSRGFMIWEKSIPGYTEAAQMHFLYNPSTVTADYYMAPDASVQGSLLFPTASDSTQLRVPLNQSVTWSLLFDRTYELWGNYNPDGSPKNPNNSSKNDPTVIGVMADIKQMQQFTGMLVGYSTGNGITPAQVTDTSIGGYQGIIQLIPSYVFFGNKSSTSALWFYGYVSEWDVTVTHWNQFMIPMRCVINITFTMMPTPPTTGGASKVNTHWSLQTTNQGTGSGNPIVKPVT